MQMQPPHRRYREALSASDVHFSVVQSGRRPQIFCEQISASRCPGAPECTTSFSAASATSNQIQARFSTPTPYRSERLRYRPRLPM
jgi:hypothetical protein